MNGTYQVIDDGTQTRIELTPQNGGPLVTLFLLGDTCNVHVDGVTSGPNVAQGQSGQSARGAILKLLLVFVALLGMFGCASADDVKGVADAANKAAGGTADTSTGSKQIDLVAGVTQTGDIQNEAWKVSAQRNVSNTAAGSNYAAVSVASGGGAEALQKAIAADVVVKLIQTQLDKLDDTKPETAARADQLRAEMTARVTALSETMQRGGTPTDVHDVYQIVIAPSSLGRDLPGFGPDDVSGAKQLVESIKAAKNAPAEAPTEVATSRPAQ